MSILPDYPSEAQVLPGSAFRARGMMSITECGGALRRRP